MVDFIGQTIDRYQILDQLGQGGMATVYLAIDKRLDRKVAIKIIRREVFSPLILEKILKRFELEEKSLAQLNHPNIVPLLDYGTHDEIPYLVMPYIPSGTLNDLLGNQIHYIYVSKILVPIARALAYAHNRKIIHRDVKPNNILITETKETVLSDFGIAKLIDEIDVNTLTSTGMGLGTPEYMAPEQWHGKIDTRCDQYGLGVIIYELVTGNKPYNADTPSELMLKQATEPFCKPSEYSAGLPAYVEKMILKTLEKDPNNRYSDMHQLAKVLENFSQERVESEDIYPKVKLSSDKNFYEQVDVKTKYERSDAEQIDNRPIALGQETLPHDLQPTKIYDENAEKNKSLKKKNKRLFVRISFGMILLIFLSFIFKFPYQLFTFSITPTQKIELTNTTFVEIVNKPLVTPSKTITFTAVPSKTITVIPTETSIYGIGSIRISEIDGMEMVYVPPGSFIKGKEGIFNSSLEEKYLDGFWIDKTEITNKQFFICVNGGGCTKPIPFRKFVRIDGSYVATYPPYSFEMYQENNPVWNVEFQHAKEYCAWANRRLPSEDEWEKAARGELGFIYVWGNEAVDTPFYTYGSTHKVGLFSLDYSYYHVYDLQSNLMEWVSSGNLRGGHFAQKDISELDLTNSIVRSSSEKYHYIGFRCAYSD